MVLAITQASLLPGLQQEVILLQLLAISDISRTARNVDKPRAYRDSSSATVTSLSTGVGFEAKLESCSVSLMGLGLRV